MPAMRAAGPIAGGQDGFGVRDWRGGLIRPLEKGRGPAAADREGAVYDRAPPQPHEVSDVGACVLLNLKLPAPHTHHPPCPDNGVRTDMTFPGACPFEDERLAVVGVGLRM